MSASPEASEEPKKITFRFCRECSNMLYPKEDRVNKQLMFACRTCQFSEPAQSSCVYRNELRNTVGETAGITQDVGSDPTVGLPDMCTLCGTQIFCEICAGRTENGVYLEVDDHDTWAGSHGDVEDGEEEYAEGEHWEEEKDEDEEEQHEEQQTGT